MKQPDAMKEIHDIREKMAEEDKNLSAQEHVRKTNEIALQLLKKWELEKLWVGLTPIKK